MKTVQQIMQEAGAEVNIRNFRYMQENYTYKQKVRHAENVARSYQDKCSEMGLNCHVSVGGLDSITLHYFLESCGVHVPCVSCSSLEQKGVQTVHKQIAAEMENTYSAREWLGAHMALSQEEIDKCYSMYAGEPFTHYVSRDIDLKQVVNTNRALVHAQKYGDRLLVTSVIDNLLKGAAGQAVENMNIMFGIAEDAGLKLKAAAF